MSSGDAFNQVKALLGKLDRSIDEARARRTGTNDDETLDGEARVHPETRGDMRVDSRDPHPDARPAHRETGTPGRATDRSLGAKPGAAQSLSADATTRRDAANQPIGASPTNSNPTRRPGIGRARPLNRQGDAPTDDTASTKSGTDDTWVGGSGSND